MAKISQASSKYIIHAKIEIDGVVDRPDVVGAIFGQIEGLLGADLELRELQRSGRIGRIEVIVKSKDGKTTGTIDIPSSLDKAETAIVAGALEIIERIGPCEANITILSIEDERIAKRQQVITRAKELLKNMNDSTMPDSGELSSEVSDSVRVKQITTYGKDKLPAGPQAETSDEVILVEGRADVVNLLRHGFKNVVSMNGTSIPPTVKKLCKEKEVTVFCDGDRGGDIILRELLSTCDIDYVTKAPDGKEVEELQKKEIHQCLRARVAAKDWGKKTRNNNETKRISDTRKSNDLRNKPNRTRRSSDKQPRKTKLTNSEKEQYKKLIEELEGSKEVYILDKKHNILGKVPSKDLSDVMMSLDDVFAVVVDGKISEKLAATIDKKRPKHVVAKEATNMRTTLITPEDLE